MKSRMFLIVKRLWPLAAFIVAACLVAGFLNFQRKAAEAQSPEKLRGKRCAELLGQAAKYADDQSYDKALQVLEQVTAEYRSECDPSVDLDAADACLKIFPPQVDRALEHVDAFMHSAPANASQGRAYRIQGEVAFAKGDRKTALDYFNKFYATLEPGFEDYHVLSLVGRCYLELNDDASAEKNWRKVAGESSDYREPEEARYYLGALNAARYARSNDKQFADAALAEFKRVTEDMVNADLRYAARVQTADVLLALGEYDKAKDAYMSALEVLPSTPEMTRLLKGGNSENTRDELLQLQVLGAPQTVNGQEQRVPATKLQKVVQYYRAGGDASRLPDAIEALKQASAKLDNKQAVYLQIAGLYDGLISMARTEIAALENQLQEWKRSMSDRLRTEAAYRLEKDLQSRRDSLGEYLRAAADYYERGFNEDPYQKTPANYREHPLWKAAERLMERRDYASAERVLLRLLDPSLKVTDKVMIGETCLQLGEMYRDLGRYDAALTMFRNITENRPGAGVGDMDFLGWATFEEAVTLAMMGKDAEAVKMFEVITRDDNPWGADRRSKIWRESTFELCKLRYSEAFAVAGPERVERLLQLAEYATEALDRYAAFLEDEPSTRDLLLYYVGDSLNHLALEAVSRGENQKARENFQKAREYLAKMTEVNDPPEKMPVFYRNGRVLYAQTLDFESRIAPDGAEKDALAKQAIEKYDEAAKSLENTEQGLWALIQLGALADASNDEAIKATAKRYYDLAEAGIRKLQESNAFSANPKGFDAAYVQEILNWLRDRAGQEKVQ